MGATPPQVTSSVAVRPLERRDLQFTHLCWNDPDTQQMMKTGGGVSLEAQRVWLDKQLSFRPPRAFVGILNGRYRVGIVRFIWQSTDLFDVSIILAPDYRGRGLAKQLLRAAILSFLVTTPRAVLFASAKAINPKSIACFLGVGFEVCSLSDVPDCPKTRQIDARSEIVCRLRSLEGLETGPQAGSW
jgi:RimJ/RimL family protein N-acetyltransferase